MARTVKLIFLVLAVVLIAGAVVVRGINSRIKAAAIVKKETLDLAVPSVAVIHPKRGAMKDEIALPGNIMAFIDSPIYARTSGYLKKWYADIGTHVKSGQLIAEIESPEVDQQLDQARADPGYGAGQSETRRADDEPLPVPAETGSDRQAGRGQRRRALTRPTKQRSPQTWPT